MDDGHGLRTQLAVGVDMGHHIVTQLLLPLGCSGVVDVLNMGLQLIYLLLGDGQSQFHLCPGQSHPQAAPGGELFVRGENILHLVAGVAGGQGAFIAVG